MKRYDGVPAAAIRDNLIVSPLGRALTLFAAGPLTIARNRLVSQGTTGRDLEIMATAVLVGNLGISNEWTLGLLWMHLFLLFGGGAFAPGVNQCALTKFFGSIDAATGKLQAPLTTGWPSGKSLVTENQITSDTVDQPLGASFSSTFVFSLDDLGFTDNQCEIETQRRFFITDVFAVAGSVRVADNRLSETWLRTLFSAWSIGLMNTTTDNQSTHCLRADALLPLMRVFRDNLNFITAYCPDECRRQEG